MKINWLKIGRTIQALVTRAWTKVQENPVIVRTTLALAVSAGYLELSDKQLDSINTAVVIAVLLFGAVSATRATEALPKDERTPWIPGKNKRSNSDGEES